MLLKGQTDDTKIEYFSEKLNQKILETFKTPDFVKYVIGWLLITI